MKITKTQLRQIIKEELETALEGPEDPEDTRTGKEAALDKLKAALEAFYETYPDEALATAEVIAVVEKFVSAEIGMPIELRY